MNRWRGCPSRRQCLALALLLMFEAGLARAPAAGYQSLGTPVLAAEIRAQDTDLAPQGRVPPGRGSVAEGRTLFAAQCQHCHGERGTGALHEPLALSDAERSKDSQRAAFAVDPTRVRVIGNFWPYATTLYDYIHRAMPQLSPGSLSSDQAYALTAYVLHLNGLLAEDAVVDGAALQQLQMPARQRIRVSAEAETLTR